MICQKTYKKTAALAHKHMSRGKRLLVDVSEFWFLSREKEHQGGKM